MKFLLDHDVPDDLSYMLEQLGHEVVLLRKALPDDSSDEAVLCFLAATPPRLAQSELGNRYASAPISRSTSAMLLNTETDTRRLPPGLTMTLAAFSLARAAAASFI